jgi:putative transposase
VSEAKEAIAEFGKPCPVAVACAALGAARSSWYEAEKPRDKSPAKRGPVAGVSDEALLAAIREVIADCRFHGEGYRKVHVRVRYMGKRLVAGKNRVLRLMRLNNLLAPVRRVHEHGNHAHDRHIITARPNEMWGADATTFWTEEDGQCWFFGVIDHFNSECAGWNVEKRGDRWAAIESVRHGVRRCFGKFEHDAARGVRLRHDWGSQYVAKDFQADIAFAGITSAPAYVGEPETNGVAERFMRTLKEQCIWLRRFKNVEEARLVIGEFVERYNSEWLIGRLNYRTPVQARADYEAAERQKAAEKVA